MLKNTILNKSGNMCKKKKKKEIAIYSTINKDKKNKSKLDLIT